VFVVMGVCYIGVLEHTLTTTGLKSMVHYTRVFVVKGFVISGCHCTSRSGGSGEIMFVRLLQQSNFLVNSRNKKQHFRPGKS